MVNPVDLTKWEQVALRIGPINSEGCWPWVGHISSKGYGVAKVKGKANKAHRHVFVMVVGPIAEGMVLDHECHNRAAAAGNCAGGDTCRHRRCVNPGHLRQATHAENIAAGNLGYASRKLCRAGLHDITAPDSWVLRTHGRQCRLCEQSRRGRADGTE